VLDQIAELTKTMLQHMGIQAEVTITVDGHKVAVHILGGEDHEAIVGRDGSTLDAMQYLLRKIVGQKFPEKISLSLDAGTYRQQRQTELEQLALELAQKVKDTGKSQVISALNPAERRLVHVALQDDTSIRSASIGDGLFKKVRIYLPGKGRRRSGRGGGESSGQES
jgi:spoIIIJ-associated protein